MLWYNKVIRQYVTVNIDESGSITLEAKLEKHITCCCAVDCTPKI